MVEIKNGLPINEEEIKKKLNDISESLKTASIEKDKLEKSLKDIKPMIEKKVKPSTGMILSYIEAFVIFFAIYFLPVIMLFVDKNNTLTIGSALCDFYTNNLDAVIMIYFVLSSIFVAKTFTKTKEAKAHEVISRSNFGRNLVMIIGVGIFSLYIFVYPMLNFLIPTVNSFYNSIQWQTVGFIFTLGAQYIGNKLVYATNKDELLSGINNVFVKQDNNTEENVEDSK